MKQLNEKISFYRFFFGNYRLDLQVVEVHNQFMKQLNEKIILRNVLGVSIGLFIIFGIMFSLALIFEKVSGELSSIGFSLTWFAFGSVLLYLFCVLWAWVYNVYAYHFYRYSVEESCLKVEKGIIWKTYKSIPYKKIQNVDISRGVLDRFLGLSNLNVQTAGSSYPNLQTYEGSLPGLSFQTAQDLQKELTKKASLSS